MNKIIVNGGSSSSNGVTYYGLRYKVQSRREKNGKITTDEKMYNRGPEWVRKMEGYPLLNWIATRIRGLYNDWVGELAFIFIPVFTLTAGKFTSFLILGFSLGLVLFAAGKFFNSKQRQATRYHGAEHKVHNVYMLGKKLDILSTKGSSRFHKFCGGNYFITITLYTAITFYLAVPTVVKIPLWFLIYRELMRPNPNLIGKILTPVHYIGYFYQLGSTSVPTDAELEVAVSAMNRILVLENSG